MFNKKSLRGALVVVGLLALNALGPVHAAQVRWQIKFYDEVSKLKNVGSFTYDDSTVDWIPLDPAGTNGFYVDHLITGYHFKLMQNNWYFAGWDQWWFDERYGIGRLDIPAGDYLANFGSWVLGDYETETIQIQFNSGENNFYSGTWSYSNQLATPETIGPSVTHGIVTARLLSSGPAVAPVPVPAALPLFVSALAGLGLLSRRKRKV